MKPSTAWILPVFAALISCGSTAPKRTGDPGKDLEIRRSQDGGRLVVTSLFDAFVLPLPYADDWTFHTAADKPLFGTSAKAPMTASVQIFTPGRRLDEKAYLWDELYKQQKATLERLGVVAKDGKTITLKQGLTGDPPHWALEFRTESPQLQQMHYWSVRQNREGQGYLLHLSTSAAGEPRLDDVRNLAQVIAMDLFKIVD